LIQGEAGWGSFSKKPGLVGGGERNHFVENAAADLGDIPVLERGVNLVPDGLGNINRSEAGEPGGAEPAGGGFGTQGLAGVGVGELLPEFFHEVGREDLFGTGVEENSREQAAECFPVGWVGGLRSDGERKAAGDGGPVFGGEGF
jgi:hypothetical protein